MSEYKKKIVLGAVLAVVIAIGLAGATILVAPQPATVVSTQSQQSSLNTSASQILTSQSLTSTSGQVLSSSTANGNAQPALIVQLTDPPIVPVGTTSLNLTYSAIDLLVAVPSATTSSTTSTSTSASVSTEITTQTITLTPTGGSATVDLLKLQNISQTIASADLPNGTTIYSVSFLVSSISIDINGVISPVTLATGGNTLLVTLSTPAVVRGTIAVLLDLNPTIIGTTTGYQMIPSSIGVILPQIEITPQIHQIGYTHQLTNQDQFQIKQLKGQVTAKLVGISVSGSTSTIIVQISNSGNYSAQVVSIGVSGNFTIQNCATTTTSSTSSHGHSGNPIPPPRSCEGINEIAFVPSVTSSTTSSSTTTTTSTTTTSSSSTSSGACTTGKMTLDSLGNEWNANSQLVLSPGQCITLTFTGTISLGPSSNILVPSTQPGQTYTVQVITSNIPMGNPCIPFSPMAGCQGSPGNNGQGQDGQGGSNNGRH